MTRLFLPPELLIPEQITITGDQSRYLSLVLRIQPGEQITIFDGSGFRYICKILRVHKKEVVVEKIRKEPYSVESPIHITLAQGIAKGEKMDFIIQKSTELGVNKIIPLITEYSQIRRTEKTERWRKIALSAAQQCGREKVPEIMEPVEFGKFIEQVACFLTSNDTNSFIPVKTGIQKPFKNPGFPDKSGNANIKRIIFSEDYKERNLKKVLVGLKDIKQVTLLIGTEGGFSKDEVTAAVEKGFVEVSLGPRILRTETAPIAAISIIQYELGDVG